MDHDERIQLRVRINHIDHTIAPSGPLDNTSLRRVPVIRIYGDTSLGQKACVIVHQVYPYFFVEYPGKIDPKSVNQYIYKLTRSLNHAIAVSLKRNPQSVNSQFVRSIILVKGVHFYGFHSSYTPFLKILLADPAYINRAATIMQSGTVMHMPFRVYETHISFILQFLCDFGLYGCGWMDLGEVLQRAGDAVFDENGVEVISELLFPPSSYFRHSRMPLEIDVAAHQIFNRHKLTARNLHHKFTIPAPPLPAEPLVPSVRELWEDERRRRATKGLNPSPELPVDPTERSRGTGGEWVAEVRYWDGIKKRIEHEREHEFSIEPKETWEQWVMTTFESVEALWEDQWKTWRPEKLAQKQGGEHISESEERAVANPFGTAVGQASQDVKATAGGEGEEAELEVDEATLASQALRQLVQGAEEQVPEEQEPMDVEDVDVFQDQEDEENHPPSVDAKVLAGRATSGGVSKDDVRLPDGTSTSMDVPPSVRTPTKGPMKRSNAFGTAFGKMAIAEPSTTGRSISPTPMSTPKRLRISYGSYRSPSTSPTKNSRYRSPPPRTPLKTSMTLDLDDDGPLRSLLDTARQSLAFAEDDNEPSAREISASIPAFASPLHEMNGAGQPIPQALPNGSVSSVIIGGRSHEKREISTFDAVGIQWPSSYSTRNVSSQERTGATPRAVFKSQFSSPAVPTSVTDASASFAYAHKPPSRAIVVSTMEDFDQPLKIYRNPLYSKASDAPEKPREYAGLVYHLKGGTGLGILDNWSEVADMDGDNYGLRPNDRPQALRAHFVQGWEYTGVPPGFREVVKWARTQPASNIPTFGSKRARYLIESPTQLSSGLKGTPKLRRRAGARASEGLTMLSLEIFAPSRGTRLPDPGEDPVSAVFFAFQDFDFVPEGVDRTSLYQEGAIVLSSSRLCQARLRDVQLDVAGDELEVINRVADIVCDLDPDILTGWELQSNSWGYLNARAYHHGLNLVELLSRAPPKQAAASNAQYDARHTSTFKVIGRHVLNLWRIMRSEQTLRIYTFENVVFHLLRERVPRYTASTLTEWSTSDFPDHASRLLRYFRKRVRLVLKMLDEADVVTRTAEFARVFGVDFFSVISRGSQFKVESFMLRIAKPESFVFISPSKQDVGKQNAVECIPLVMEPLSAFYNSPLVVLDFQSLYPSIMIAYNYCYSTCLGRVEKFHGQYKLGITELNVPPGLLGKLENDIHVAPNGIMYVKPHVRKGLLGRMLTELLETRVMVKQAMKGVTNDKILRRILDARQLGLKFISNVTYGYTSATYSGRMPAVEIADSIVQSGRETLEKAIRVIDSTPKWGAKVVYGDTDSLFIYLRGRTKEQAFRIGHDMADTITAMNPSPVKLKFEKVYLPCVLIAKKRYVGFKLEHPDEITPTFDAKGIETVRRDGCAAQAKMTEACLKILFRSQDLSAVKAYCTRTWLKIIDHQLTIEDFIFAKEVKMGTYSDKVPPLPGVTIAARRTLEDPNDEPQYGERVPYVIVKGQPGARLVDRAVSPEEVLNESHKTLDAAYYINNVLIPPLERIFNLVGADVRAWYYEMPKSLRADMSSNPLLASPTKSHRAAASVNRLKIDEHFRPTQCILCDAEAVTGLCRRCQAQPMSSLAEIRSCLHEIEDRLQTAHAICAACSGCPPAEPCQCESLDCPNLYARKKAEAKAEMAQVLTDIAHDLEHPLDRIDGDTDTTSEVLRTEPEDERSDAEA